MEHNVSKTVRAKASELTRGIRNTLDTTTKLGWPGHPSYAHIKKRQHTRGKRGQCAKLASLPPSSQEGRKKSSAN
eukprot:6455219-Amphidinium_carterae.3